VEATNAFSSVISKVEVKGEGSSGNDGNENLVIEAVLASREDVLFGKSNFSGEDSSTSSNNLKFEATNSNNILNGTTSMHGVIFIELGFFVKSDGSWLPWVIRLAAAVPFGGIVSKSESSNKSEDDQSLHLDIRNVNLSFRYLII